MKCYYEELGVERDASDVDIKSAYRKLALRWHPDKNPDNLEDAKQRFLLIQQAYEVLIDPQERAFYDNHRDQILRGKNSNFEDNCLNVYEYFTVTCFRGYADTADGFYAVYREVFNKIATEDAEFMDDEDEVENIPNFGDSKSNYEDVVAPFYAYWSAYCTKKTYTWLCPYDIQEAKDRRIIRAIDKSMKKVVQKAKKDRNEEVRSLVAFVRKRDKRVHEYNRKLEERTILNRKKQEQMRLEQIQKRHMELQEMQKNAKKTEFDESYEAQLRELEQQYEDSDYDEYDVDDAEDEEDYECEDNEDSMKEDIEDESEGKLAVDYDDLFCVACNKKYKNKRAYVDHEMNKKHQDNVEQMRKEMLDEEAAIANWDNLSEIEETTTATPVSEKNKRKKSKYQPINELLEDLENLEVHKTDTEIVLNAGKSDDDEIWTEKKANKKKKNKKTVDTNSSKPKQINKVEAEPEEIAAAAASSKKNDEDVPSTSEHACATCGTRFESKNKLFAHLKATKHSVYLKKPQAAADADISSHSSMNNKKSKNKKR